MEQISTKGREKVAHQPICSVQIECIDANQGITRIKKKFKFKLKIGLALQNFK
jgi:hypothetical protein